MDIVRHGGIDYNGIGARDNSARPRTGSPMSQGVLNATLPRHYAYSLGMSEPNAAQIWGAADGSVILMPQAAADPALKHLGRIRAKYLSRPGASATDDEHAGGRIF